MLIAEAHRRVALSRQILSWWLQYGLEDSPESALATIHAELLTLENIADVHPGELQHILSLVMSWIGVQEQLKRMLH